MPGLLNREWLITNGLGGYASATISGAVTWRYHGLLIAALPAPLGRTTMLNHLEESLYFPDRRLVRFGGAEASDPENKEAPNYLVEFRLENQMPVWRYDVQGVVIEKRIIMPYLQNTVHVTFTLLSKAEGIFLELRPSVHFRPFEGHVGPPCGEGYEIRALGHRFEINAPKDNYPALRLYVATKYSRFIHEGGAAREIVFPRDAERGFEARGALWTPGYFPAAFEPDVPVTLVASTEDWHTVFALDPEAAFATECERRRRLLRIASPQAQHEAAAELVLAADHFIISPAGRVKDAARARAAGDELRSVIAGYHWFTDWGRDTMISLEGLTLTTGRFQEAAWILRTFAHYVRHGLIPNMFPEGKNEGLYHTADATLWFFHAVHRYIEATNDQETLAGLLPILQEIVEHHLRGTKFGIGVDPNDDLLRQGAEGCQLTWMDAKVGDWVVTPRRGKAVEINALWFNALKLLEGWQRAADGVAMAEALAAHAQRAQDSFNERFWNPSLDCLYDVIDVQDGSGGNDPAVRPNQVLAISLAHAVLTRERWAPVLKIVEEQLVTPVGLRSLHREHRDYKAKYYGDLRSRDAAYHQGTVWGWLIGPFIDAWLKVHPDDHAGAREFLEGFAPHLGEACLGSISEIFDAEEPFTPRGCIAQAWSVAEVLRCLALTANGTNGLKEEVAVGLEMHAQVH
ncbi:MAG: amylo-alpha-1,6-glucosidase [Opitutaceae bacterium]|nr:amylo-alpha-1,6-glucosidase [Opitutaceae bacterium]